MHVKWISHAVTRVIRTIKYVNKDKNNAFKLWAFGELSRAFPHKVTPDVGFADEVVVQCDVPDVKILLLGTGNLLIISNKLWCKYK